jgi:hypothetical protein
MGPDVDYAKAASSREALVETFYEISHARHIEFGDLVVVANYQPNIRMVDRFSVGRVFIVGGECVDQ